MAPTTTHLSPIWQSLPLELVHQVLHELVSIHLGLWNIYIDPFYPWETLRQLNHQQRQRIDALYRQLLLPMLSVGIAFYPDYTTSNPYQPGLDNMRRFCRFWTLKSDDDFEADEDHESTLINEDKDTVTLFVSSHHPRSSRNDCLEYKVSRKDGRIDYLGSFPRDGLCDNPIRSFFFQLNLDYNYGYRSLVGEIRVSHVPDVQEDEAGSIIFNSSQLIGELMRTWKKSNTTGGGTGQGRWYFPLRKLRSLPRV
ncbi:hypothetical protein QBC45DRAFT_383907 [Copromyces sp. CBS 386.78]|nr:hypothetical protein QBC45DRAFT_383907 [Copromyces sp. CBS 386.78]